MLEPSNSNSDDWRDDVAGAAAGGTRNTANNNNINGDNNNAVPPSPSRFTTTANNTNNGLLAWRERERRQRTVRVLIMFLLMLLLMDGEDGTQQQSHQNPLPHSTSTRQRYRQRQQQRLRARAHNQKEQAKQQQKSVAVLSLPVWTARQAQDATIQQHVQRHARYWALVEKNGHRRMDQDAQLYLQRIVDASRRAQNITNPTQPIIAREADLLNQLSAANKDETKETTTSAFGKDSSSSLGNDNPNNKNKEEDATTTTVWHYPWNTTGFYRGQWTMVSLPSLEDGDDNTNATTDTTAMYHQKDAEPQQQHHDENDKEEEQSYYFYDMEEEEKEMAEFLSKLLPPINNNSGSNNKNANHNKDDNNTSSSFILEPKTLEPPELEDILLARLAWHSKRNGHHPAPQQQQQQQRQGSSSSSSLSTNQSLTDMVGSVYLLPPGLQVKVRDDHNLTRMDWDQMTSDANGNLYTATSSSSSPPLEKKATDAFLLRGSSSSTDDSKPLSSSHKLSLTRSNGRAAFQLYSKSVPGMKELSLVDGFCKLYDHTSPGYSTRNDVLLRVRGVLLHGVGHLSLVSSNVPVTQTALVLSNTNNNGKTNTRPRTPTNRHLQQTNVPQLQQQQQQFEQQGQPNQTLANNTQTLANNSNNDSSSAESNTLFDAKEPLESEPEAPAADDDKPVVNVVEAARRRLQEAITDLDVSDMAAILKDADVLVENHKGNDDSMDEEEATSWFPLLTTSAFDQRPRSRRRRRTSAVQDDTNKQSEAANSSQQNGSPNNSSDAEAEALPLWSDVVIPYPYVMDDEEESIRKTRTPGSRRMPHREQLLESNSMDCPFEMSLQIEETEWSLEEYRTLMKHKWNEHKRLDPTNPVNQLSAENATASSSTSNPKKKVIPLSTTPYRTSKPRKNTLSDQALVINMIGSIQSRECDFYAHVNVTALRTDWDATTSKAINYSFYMMLVCLVQIILLLRQLLHSQTQSAATRVSMICIGWQTVLDALICLGHIYLCLAMQPLFTAFASVAFFKCLIFCVIEMKYMAIIIQARNSAAGGQPTEVLRRQVAILHLRFYLALLTVFLILFYIGEKYRTLYMLALYSFWLPQIILNAVTEAKMPMHKYYIYGMSITRLVVPVYLFGIRNNFLKEVYPEAPFDLWTCQLLILWVAFQTAVLLGQINYGARFWIPQQFLPPKYDYSRPIPPSILSNARNENATTPTTEFVDTTSRRNLSSHHHHATSQTTRNRLRTRNNNSQHGGGGARSTSNGSGGGGTTTTTEENPTTSSVSPSVSSPSSSSADVNATTTSTTSATLDCSICYESIDVMRQQYMLAPCDHLFHKDCLLQWMDIKMECPICRTDLPAL